MMNDEITCGAPYRQGSATGFHICGGIHRPWPQNVCGLCNCEPVYSPAPAPMAEPISIATFPGTLRDWFAGMALTGLAAAHDADGVWSGNCPVAAAEAYKLADAMMKAREARK
jgi:hypothetical protein